LHPSHVQLDMRPGRGERIQTMLSAPMQVGAQVGLGVNSRLALEPGQIGGCRQPDRINGAGKT
jgi:hypothetical protein